MVARIINRGRGPEIEGTRVTVYRVMDCLRDSCSKAAICEQLDLTTEQVQVALEYIEDYKAEVEKEYDNILQRASRGNPAWVKEGQAKTVDELKARLLSRRKTQLEPLEDDSLTDDLLASNPKFQALVSKSKASPRKPLSVGYPRQTAVSVSPFPNGSLGTRSTRM